MPTELPTDFVDFPSFETIERSVERREKIKPELISVDLSLFRPAVAANEIEGVVRDLHKFFRLLCVPARYRIHALAQCLGACSWRYSNIVTALRIQNLDLDYDQEVQALVALVQARAHAEDQQRQSDSAVLHQFQ